MATVDPPVRPETDHSSKIRRYTGVGSEDDDLSLSVSIYLDSDGGDSELVENVQEVLQAYGFAHFSQITQAPGSSFISIKVTHVTNNYLEARRDKEELNRDLVNEKPPSDPAKCQAVSKLKKSLWQRAKKKVVAIVVSGVIFIGTVTGDIFKDVVKDEIEKWLESKGPQIAQTVDTVVAKELPPSVAKSFHEAVEHYIDNSDKKTFLEPPPPTK